MFYIQIFSFSTGLAPNYYEISSPFYGSLMAQLGELVRCGEVNQFS